MLPRSRKLAREAFPRRTERYVSWNGTVLRFFSYPYGAVDVKGHPACFAVVVPSRFGKSAVSRNRLKRAVFSSIKDKLSLFDVLPYTKHTIFPLKSVESISESDILRDIEQFLSDKSPK